MIIRTNTPVINDCEKITHAKQQANIDNMNDVQFQIGDALSIVDHGMDQDNCS